MLGYLNFDDDGAMCFADFDGVTSAVEIDVLA